MSIEAPSAVIFGTSGPVLTAAERDFFRAVDPLGFILFARNIEGPDQVRRLVGDLRDSVGRNAPILIDQEGGRVQRLRPPHWAAAPSARALGALGGAAAVRATWITARLIAAELADLGIDVNCAPVLDRPVPGAHDVIGDRAYSTDSAEIATLGQAVIRGLMDGGVLPVIKHVPGHGRAAADSHLELPVVRASAAEMAPDLAPFQALNDAPFAMTAHVLYPAWDAEACATLSARVIGTVIRGQIGFQGALISDDLGMRALGGDFGERARRALAAGCDLVLHCSGDAVEMAAVAAATGPLTGPAARRVADALARRQPPAPVDVAALRAERAGLMSGES